MILLSVINYFISSLILHTTVVEDLLINLNLEFINYVNFSFNSLLSFNDNLKSDNYIRQPSSQSKLSLNKIVNYSALSNNN